MICIWQVFGDMQNLRYIAEMFIFDFIGATTIFDSGLSRAEVSIKLM